MYRELQLNQTCQRLHLPAGAVVHCHAGRLWLTRETRDAHARSPDIVLAPGQQHRVEAAGDHFLTHLHSSGEPVRCAVELPAAQGKLRPAFSVR